MRSEFSRLKKNNSTKSERRIAEILKKNHIKFLAHRKIGKFEIDFIIGKLVLEVDGSAHTSPPTKKDIYLSNKGYVPIHVQTGKYDEKFSKELLCLIKANNQRIKIFN